MALNSKQRSALLYALNVVVWAWLWAEGGWTRLLAYCGAAAFIIVAGIVLIATWIGKKAP